MEIDISDAAWVPIAAALFTALIREPNSKFGRIVWAVLNTLAINVGHAKNAKKE